MIPEIIEGIVEIEGVLSFADQTVTFEYRTRNTKAQQAEAETFQLHLDQLRAIELKGIWGSTIIMHPRQLSTFEVEAAKTFLSGVTGHFGNQMEEALREALAQFESSDFSNAILVFTDGRWIRAGSPPRTPTEPASSPSASTTIWTGRGWR